MQWGIEHVEIALQEYVKHQHSHGHSGLFVCASGVYFYILRSFTRWVCLYYDPHADEPYGFLEITCPYSQREKIPVEACSSATFCCQLQEGRMEIATNPQIKPSKYKGKWPSVDM